MIVVQKTTTPTNGGVNLVVGVTTFRDSRGPQGKDGEKGPRGDNIIIQEPADPGDSFILALEGGMI